MDKNMAGRGRPGGNPDFGTKYRFDYGNEEKKTEALTIRVTPSFLQEIKNTAGDRYRDFCRDAIQDAIAKIKTTELETAGQQQPHNQTSQEAQEQLLDPTPGEQATTPKIRRKATQTQGQKPKKPTTQSQSRKSSATEN